MFSGEAVSADQFTANLFPAELLNINKTKGYTVK